MSSGVKSSFFNSYVLEQLIRLYDSEESAPRVHVLMTELVTARREDSGAEQDSADAGSSEVAGQMSDEARAERERELAEDKQLHPQHYHNRKQRDDSAGRSGGDGAWRNKHELNHHRRTMLRLLCKLKVCLCVCLLCSMYLFSPFICKCKCQCTV